MTNPTCIAVGVDFSSEADRAAIEAREIARHLEEELVLVHASTGEDVEAMMVTGLASAEWSQDQVGRVHDRANARLGDMRDRLASEGVTIKHALIEGHPDSALGDAAHEVGAEMIVVGTHGRTGLAWALLGSVSERVVRSADLDVLVARDPDPPRGGYRRVMVATDFSPSAARAFHRALALAAPDARIDVVHFFHGRPDRALRDNAEEMLGITVEAGRLEEILASGRSFIGERREPGPCVRFYAVEQTPGDGIAHWLTSEPFDLVAVGSHGRRGVRRLVLGSVSEAIARNAPCSVLVARGPA